VRFFEVQDELITTAPTFEDLGCTYTVIDNIDSLQHYLEDFQSLIDQFNSYIEWDQMFTLEDVIERIKNGYIVVLAFYNDKPVSYCFSNKGWIINLFVTKKTPRPNYTFLATSLKITEESFNRYNKAAYEAEEWNKPMFLVARTCGYTEVKKSSK